MPTLLRAPSPPPDPWGLALAFLPLVRRVAHEFRRGPWDTDDLIQEGLLGAHHAALWYDPRRGSVFALVNAAARNRMRDWLRWRRLDDAATGDVAQARGRDLSWDRDALLDVLAAIESLTGLQRSVINAYFGLSGQRRTETQIGVVLGKNRDAVAQLRSRGLARLRKRLMAGVCRPAARRPCAICGTLDGVISPGRRSPERLSLARFGLAGSACRTCYVRLYGRQRAGLLPGPDVRRLPPGRRPAVSR